LREGVDAIKHIETDEQKRLKKELDTFIIKYDKSKEKFKDDEDSIYEALVRYQKLIWKLKKDEDIKLTLKDIEKSNKSMIDIFEEEEKYFKLLKRLEPIMTKRLNILKNTQPGFFSRFIGSMRHQQPVVQQEDQKIEQDNIDSSEEQKDNNSQIDNFFNNSPQILKEQTSNSINKYESDSKKSNFNPHFNTASKITKDNIPNGNLIQKSKIQKSKIQK